VPCVKTSFVSFAQTLLLWSRRFGSGNEDFDGDDDLVGDDDLLGDAEDRFTGLFVGESNFKSMTRTKKLCPVDKE